MGIVGAGVSRTSVRSVLTSCARSCTVVVRIIIASPTLSVLYPSPSSHSGTPLYSSSLWVWDVMNRSQNIDTSVESWYGIQQCYYNP